MSSKHCPIQGRNEKRGYGSRVADPEQIRTADLPLRRRTLYPAELQDHQAIECRE